VRGRPSGGTRARADGPRAASGSYVVRFPAEVWGGAALAHELLLPIWRSPASVSLMVDKKAKTCVARRGLPPRARLTR
jgi:hypothetical protein